MSCVNLIRVPRSDINGQSVLVHATTREGRGDITLEATEGERAFTTKIRPLKINLYKHKQFTGSNDELEAIFLYVFRKVLPDDITLTQDIQLLATIDTTGLSLVVRKVIGGIKRGVAEIKVPEAEVEISIFDWAVESCESLELIKDKMQLYESKIDTQTRTIESLKAQLEKLATMKKEHDRLILSQFKKVLDEKRVKIIELTNSEQSALREPEPKLESEPEEEPEPEPEPIPKRKTTRKAAPKTKPASKSTVATRRRKQPSPSPPPPPVDDDATASEDEETRKSDHKSSEDEDELPPVRKPVAFGKSTILSNPAPAPAPALVSAPTPAPVVASLAPAITDDDTDDEDDEL
ncbi:hypothetical protein EDC01DRAFT_176906 [Geopyxis carbonaria]|nr:hypothetical protein EDC01DRAFT_176906 [Geopyxis carbonaria]